MVATECKTSSDRIKARAAAIVLVLAALLPVACASSTQPLTADALAKLRRTWRAAGLRDYDLFWSTSGVRSARYRVFVRDGAVQRIDSIQTDGTVIEAKPAEPSMYSVDGLFRTLREELDQLAGDTPFGKPKGTRCVLAFEPDPKLGYPRVFDRDVMGASKGVEIRVEKLVPREPQSPGPAARNALNNRLETTPQPTNQSARLSFK